MFIFPFDNDDENEEDQHHDDGVFDALQLQERPVHWERMVDMVWIRPRRLLTAHVRNTKERRIGFSVIMEEEFDVLDCCNDDELNQETEAEEEYDNDNDDDAE